SSRSRAANRQQSDDEQQELLVPTTTLQVARIERYYRTSGTLQARRQSDIVAEQMGVLRSIRVEEGDRVTKGQNLAQLDGRTLSLQAAANELQVKNLRSELERLRALSGGAVSAEEIDKQRYAVE